MIEYMHINKYRYIDYLESRWVARCQIVEHVTHEDVVLRLVGVEQRDLRLVGWVLQNRSDHLCICIGTSEYIKIKIYVYKHVYKYT